MATVLQGRSISTRGTVYDIFLDNGAPSASGFSLVDMTGATLNYKSETEDVDAHLLTSEASATFRVVDVATETVFAGMVEAQELQYRIRINRGGVLYWVGFVLLDKVTSDFGGFPYTVTVKATDGLARLKSIDYEQGDLEEFTTITDHLYHILEQVPLADYFPAGAEYLRTHTTLHPEGMAPAAANNPIERLRLSFKALRTVDKRGRSKFRTYYQALLHILETIAGRLAFSQGRYVIAETAHYARLADDVIFFRYDQTGAALAPVTTTGWGNYVEPLGSDVGAGESVVIAGGKITNLPPLRAVELTYKHFSRQNIMPQALISFGNAESVSLENFGTDEGAGSLSISGDLSITINPPVDEVEILSNRLYVVFRLRIAILNGSGGGKTLQRVATVSPAGLSYSTPQWIDGAADAFDLVFDANPPSEDLATSINQGFVFSTPPVPVSGTLTIDVNILNLIQNGVIIDDFTTGFTINDFYVESILAGSISEQYQYTDFITDTATTGTSSVVLDRELLFGDGPGDNTFGRIEYTNDNGATWQRTNGWRRWAGNYLNTAAMEHGGLIANMILGLQNGQRDQLDLSIISTNIRADELIECDNKLFLMKQGRLDMMDDTWRGRWFEVDEVYLDIVVPPIPTTDPPIGPETGFDPPGVLPPVVTPGTTGGTPPGVIATGINTVYTELEDEVPVDTTGDTGGLTVPDLEIPMFAGDILTITDPGTGQTVNVTVNYDTGFVPGLQTDPGAVPYYGPDGIVWLVPTDDTISIVAQAFPNGLPAGSYIQPNAQFTAQLQALLRKDHIDAQLFGFESPLLVGFSDWFWRTGARQGWHIGRVHFAMATNPDDVTVKLNLKYYDADGVFRYTVATHNAGGLGSIQPANMEVLPGYYRAEVETITLGPGDSPPEGLHMIIEVTKRLND